MSLALQQLRGRLHFLRRAQLDSMAYGDLLFGLESRYQEAVAEKELVDCDLAEKRCQFQEGLWQSSQDLALLSQNCQAMRHQIQIKRVKFKLLREKEAQLCDEAESWLSRIDELRQQIARLEDDETELMAKITAIGEERNLIQQQFEQLQRIEEQNNLKLSVAVESQQQSQQIQKELKANYNQALADQQSLSQQLVLRRNKLSRMQNQLNQVSSQTNLAEESIALICHFCNTQHEKAQKASSQLELELDRFQLLGEKLRRLKEEAGQFQARSTAVREKIQRLGPRQVQQQQTAQRQQLKLQTLQRVKKDYEDLIQKLSS